jgi:hypothetical protein
MRMVKSNGRDDSFINAKCAAYDLCSPMSSSLERTNQGNKPTSNVT